ncbi:hypothetical protein WQQ_43290 [Hydrocarboniphaga effusa AP103]|uniref:Uncharacterized protein n=1 Tax=Hydrocarboniphaga effusa AP103 TaxID=1172194 RepID=I7Z7W5_9GAMM|nr:hypothetical protein WQQ_43290 [Hydrocarboniphaga effusa AP103]
MKVAREHARVSRARTGPTGALAPVAWVQRSREGQLFAGFYRLF